MPPDDEYTGRLEPRAARLAWPVRRRRRPIAVALLGIGAVAVGGPALPAAVGRLADGRVVSPRACCRPHPLTTAELVRARWLVLPRSPLGRRSGPILDWAGSRLLELGGTRNGVVQRDGAAFDPGRQRWRRIAAVPRSIGLTGAVSVWTGAASQLFVTNGRRPAHRAAGAGAAAGLYDPVTNRWTVTDLPRQMLGLQLAPPVWTGQDVMLAGTSGAPARPRLAVSAYDIAHHRWRMITPPRPARHPPGAVSMVATGHRVIVWSLWSRSIRTKTGGTIDSGVDVQVLGDGRWTLRTGSWPQHRVVGGAAFARSRILIPPGQFWCGPCPAPYSESPARFADPATLRLTTIPRSPLTVQPLTQPPVWLWNGSTVLAAGESYSGNAAPDGHLGALAAYDPWSGRWHVLPRAPGRPALATAPVFAGQRLLVLTLDGSLLARQPSA